MIGAHLLLTTFEFEGWVKLLYDRRRREYESDHVGLQQKQKRL